MKTREKTITIDVAAAFATFEAETHPAAKIIRIPTDEEFARIEASIKKHGQLAAGVCIDGLLLDGRTRRAIAERLGRKFHVKEITLPEDLRPIDYVLAENRDRRHFTPADLKALAKQVLKEAPERSDRAIADQVGVSDKTVGKARKELESTAEIPQSPSRKGRDGRTTRPKPPPPAEPTDALGKVIPIRVVHDCLDCDQGTGVDGAKCKKCGGTGNYTLRDLFADNGIPDGIAFLDTILRRLEAAAPGIETMVRERALTHAPYLKPATIVASMSRAIHEMKTAKQKLQDARPYALSDTSPGWTPFDTAED